MGEIETALAQIWSEVLQIERVGRQDHFFELGGHSLLAVKLMERMRQQGLYADIRTLFAQPTLASIGPAVQQARDSGQAEVRVPPNGIPADCQGITPQMLPLVQLTARGDRADRGGSPGRGGEYPGHLSPGAAAGRDSVPLPAGEGERSVPVGEHVVL